VHTSHCWLPTTAVFLASHGERSDWRVRMPQIVPSVPWYAAGVCRERANVSTMAAGRRFVPDDSGQALQGIP